MLRTLRITLVLIVCLMFLAACGSENPVTTPDEQEVGLPTTVSSTKQPENATDTKTSDKKIPGIESIVLEEGKQAGELKSVTIIFTEEQLFGGVTIVLCGLKGSLKGELLRLPWRAEEVTWLPTEPVPPGEYDLYVGWQSSSGWVHISPSYQESEFPPVASLKVVVAPPKKPELVETEPVMTPKPKVFPLDPFIESIKIVEWREGNNFVVSDLRSREGDKLAEVVSVIVTFTEKMDSTSIGVDNHDFSSEDFSSDQKEVKFHVSIPVGEHTLIVIARNHGGDLLKSTSIIFSTVPLDELVMPPPPKVSRVSVPGGKELVEGGEFITNTAWISVSFDRAVEVESVVIHVTGATGTIIGSSTRSVDWMPIEMPPGAHTLTVKATDKFGRELEGFTPINFVAIEPDITPPEIDGPKCDPPNGATNVDPEKYKSVKIVLTEPAVSAEVMSIEPNLDYYGGRGGGTTMKITFNEPLPRSTQVTIGIQTDDGKGNVGGGRYTFTTAP